MFMKLRVGVYCFAFLVLLDVCLFGILCEAGGWNQGDSRAAAADVEESDNLPPMVALTFDDGPDAKYTEMLLDGLAKRNVRVTFFLIGANIDGNEALVKRMSEEGHVIGNHTYSHIDLGKETLICDCDEIDRTNEKIYEITGAVPVYMRPPFGDRNMELECIIDMEQVMWDVDPKDWQCQNKAEIVKRVMSKVKDNDIILLHDGYDTTVEAVFEIIDRLQADGWQFVTVDELPPDGKVVLN